MAIDKVFVGILSYLLHLVSTTISISCSYHRHQDSYTSNLPMPLHVYSRKCHRRSSSTMMFALLLANIEFVMHSPIWHSSSSRVSHSISISYIHILGYRSRQESNMWCYRQS